MPLEIQRGRSKWFYGRIDVNGKSICQNLNVRIEGKVPHSLRREGDGAFERSRAKAQVALEKFECELRGRANAEELCQTILKIRTGARMGSVPINEIAVLWQALPRRRKPSERYLSQCAAIIERFRIFLFQRHPAVKEMAAVMDVVARDFMKTEEDRGLSAKSYTDVLKLLRSCFLRLRKEAGLANNPFEGIPAKESDTVHRKPFSAPELDAILAAAKEDPFIFPLLVLGASTAMRLGDCAQLTWAQVSLETGYIEVKTGKSHATVAIPIFPILRSLLEAQPRGSDGDVFPQIAKQYLIAPDVLTNRARRVMRKVGFGDVKELAAHGLVSRGAFQQDRPNGLRRASIRDFYSFRVTWVTLALNAGLAMDLVTKVTGHKTVEIVLKHYHQPSREDFRRELSEKLPAALTGVVQKEKLSYGTIKERLATMSVDSWEGVRDELVKGIADWKR